MSAALPHTQSVCFCSVTHCHPGSITDPLHDLRISSLPWWQGCCRAVRGQRGGCTLPACAGSVTSMSACLNSTSSHGDLALGVGSSASLGFVTVLPELSKRSLDQATQRAGSTRLTIIQLLGRSLWADNRDGTCVTWVDHPQSPESLPHSRHMASPLRKAGIILPHPSMQGSTC